jgi:4-amino-4-deoxy-L-arabinose transferase-like glycosyltransferase
MPLATPARSRSTLLTILALWLAFYASFTLFTPALLDDADSVHAEVAREMLLRHDYITLYANGIRYLEKAPLLYWSMAATMRVFQLFGATSARALAVAARLPLALTVLALALLIEAFARRLFRSTRAGLYAALILLSSFGLFLFTRILLPDAAVCLFTTLALYFFWRTEELGSPHPSDLSTPPLQTPVISTEAKRSGEIPASALPAHLHKPHAHHHHRDRLRLYSGGFAAACALNVLTKGLIGVVFPLAIVVLYLLFTRGLKRTARRLRELHPWATFEAFFLIAAPWHILAGLANPTVGHPAPFRFLRTPGSLTGHWLVPLPTYGNVHGWFWFYFMNEHLLRYLNLRIPHDYDTAPLWLFWGLCFLWIMPWSAFLFKAIAWAAPFFGNTSRSAIFRSQLRRHDLPLKRRGVLLLLIWAAFVLLFFAFSTRQEYYVLPALPALAILIAGWLSYRASAKPDADQHHRALLRITTVLLVLGTLFAAASLIFLLRAQPPAPHADLATLLTEHPSDYALSMGHFLDLDARALGLFRLPLALAALSLFLGPLISLLLRRGTLRRKARPHAANLTLAAGAFGFLLAAHLGLQTFAPVLTSAQLAHAIAPQVHPQDLIVIHGEYESASTLGFYLQRPGPRSEPSSANQPIHILEGHSSNLWYGSFFPDSPPLFETPQSIAKKWASPQRIFLWQSLTDPPNQLPPLPTPIYVLVQSGGKEILSNQPNP